jgi:iron complex outermembrane receptor protein
LGTFNALGVKHNLLLGGDYYREDDYQTCCSISGLLLDNIVHGVTIGPVNLSSAFTIYRTPGWYGVDLQDQVQLRSHLFLLGGVRYDLTRDHASRIYGVGNSSDHRFTPRIGVLWQPREWLSLYGSYVENFGPATATS